MDQDDKPGKVGDLDCSIAGLSAPAHGEAHAKWSPVLVCDGGNTKWVFLVYYYGDNCR